MALGSTQTIVVCAPSSSPASPCPAGQAPATVSAYVLESSSASVIDAVGEPIDPAMFSEYGALAAYALLIPFAVGYCLKQVFSFVSNLNGR